VGGVTGVTFGGWGNLWRIRQEPKQQQQPLHTIPHRHRPFLGGLVAVVVAGVDVDFVLRKYQSYWGQLLVLQVGNHLDTRTHTTRDGDHTNIGERIIQKLCGKHNGNQMAFGTTFWGSFQDVLV